MNFVTGRYSADGSEERKIWCGNISDQVTDEILYELFLQAGPLESVQRPKDPSGRPRSFAFIVYKHECSVPYALELFRREKLFNRALKLTGQSKLHHIPVFDTHLNDFTDTYVNNCTDRLEDITQQRKEGRDRRNDRRRERNDKERDDSKPTSWAELNALMGKGSLLNGHSTSKRDDLLGAPRDGKESKSQDVPASMPDFEKLLQMGGQMMPNMMLPGMLTLGGLPFPAGGSLGPIGPNMGPMGHIMSPMGHIMSSMSHNMSPMGHNMSLMGHNMSLMGQNMYPSMQGGMSGGKRYSPEKRSGRSDYCEGRGSRRDHPYQDKRQGSQYDNRRHSDNNYNQRRHDRGYSSSRSSHERERRDRRSR